MTQHENESEPRLSAHRWKGQDRSFVWPLFHVLALCFWGACAVLIFAGALEVGLDNMENETELGVWLAGPFFALGIYITLHHWLAQFYVADGEIRLRSVFRWRSYKLADIIIRRRNRRDELDLGIRGRRGVHVLSAPVAVLAALIKEVEAQGGVIKGGSRR